MSDGRCGFYVHGYQQIQIGGALQAYVFAMLTMVFIANAADIDD